MNFKKTIETLLAALIWLLPALVFSQVQTVRGTVIDVQSETPLIGVAVELVGSSPRKGAMTDESGRFSIPGVSVGRQAFRFTYLGFEPVTIPNLVITAGKEAILDLKMQESTLAVSEVVITARTEKDKPQNELAAVSARQFSLEEVSRYSGGRNDVSRLVSNFAGVATADDSRNDIVIRGNSPTGVLWRLEGVPIPSPNHFATLGTTGGPVSALNPNMIANSDFLTSAFPAEYGNATAGVFDIGFRAGNRERHEFTAQLAAFSGFEAMAEGPLTKKKEGSYLVSYRYSFVEAASTFGIPVGTSAIPKYNDLSFKIDLGNKKWGKLSLFGIHARSHIDLLGADADTTDLFGYPDRDSYADSKIDIYGIRHNLILDDKSFVRTVVSGAFAGNNYEEKFDVADAPEKQVMLKNPTEERTLNVSSIYNRKFSPRLTFRAGFLSQTTNLQMNIQNRRNTPDTDGDGKPDWFTIREFDGTFSTGQIFSQAKYQIGKNWTVNGGLHGQIFTFNDDFIVEPRAAISRKAGRAGLVTLGYGLHAQAQPLPVYFVNEETAPGVFEKTNEQLDFTKSHHLVLGFDQKLGADWRLKIEAYRQWLFDIPVESSPTGFSMLNTGTDWVFPEIGSLKNDGTGNNTGLELTLEKFFSHGFYGLLTTSIFESTYEGSDKISRPTAFDNNFVVNLLAGKEWKIGKSGRNALTTDLKFTTSGGRPYTPVDLAASIALGEEVKDETRPFSERYDDYLRLDFKIGYRVNSKKRHFSQQFALDFANITNNKNIWALRYNEVKQRVIPVYQSGFFPDILWRVQF